MRLESPRSRIHQLLTSSGVTGEARLRAMGTFWTLALVGREGEPVDTGLLAERLERPWDSVEAAVADLTRAGLVERTPGGVRVVEFEGLGEAVARLAAFGLAG